jgi:hypothetical protein
VISTALSIIFAIHHLTFTNRPAAIIKSSAARFSAAVANG